MNNRSRKGFTLVELLIVIIIIGILAGAMMLIVHSGNQAAEAAKIINDLRSIKSAAMLYYLDDENNDKPEMTDLEKHMDKKPDGDYELHEPAAGSLYARFNLTQSGVSTGVIDRLKNNKDAVEVITSGDEYAQVRIK